MLFFEYIFSFVLVRVLLKSSSSSKSLSLSSSSSLSSRNNRRCFRKSLESFANILITLIPFSSRSI
ncbi:hypothetical protein DERP_003365 [Dermatophagoides pteronyssinus]|uniref:Uncharacterized protein n=1 Tax=Dermatophagoides pteronyssinus TaxID=6956 RepID=A0ABQ8JJS7_DERPT|nr:hypothetical protein DERP_003365 [Dermatophagoides pteronyssinus]